MWIQKKIMFLKAYMLRWNSVKQNNFSHLWKHGSNFDVVVENKVSKIMLIFFITSIFPRNNLQNISQIGWIYIQFTFINDTISWNISSLSQWKYWLIDGLKCNRNLMEKWFGCQSYNGHTVQNLFHIWWRIQQQCRNNNLKVENLNKSLG